MSWLSLIPYLAAGAIAASATWPLARAPLQGDIADLRMENAGLREANAETARLAALAASRQLAQAQQAGQLADARLTKTLARNARLTKEKTDALAAATTGGPCLRGDALRVLHGATGITVSAGVPGMPAPTGAPAAEAGAVATDTGVSQWIAAAGERYEACREQLHELIDWRVSVDDPAQPATGAEQAD